MSADVIVEFTLQDPGMYRDEYAPFAGQSAKDLAGEEFAAGNREVLYGDGSLTSGALMRYTDREPALRWCSSPEYEQLVDIRSVAMDARFRSLDGIPTLTEGERESE